MASRRGFTLIELLIVIGIIGLLMALLVPAVQRARESASRVSCMNNLRQLGIALHNYHGAKECFPPGLVSDSLIYDAEATGFTFLLPYLEQDTTYRIYDFDSPWYQKPNYRAVGIQIKTFFCPSNRTTGDMDLAPIAAQWNSALPPQGGELRLRLLQGGQRLPDQELAASPARSSRSLRRPLQRRNRLVHSPRPHHRRNQQHVRHG